MVDGPQGMRSSIPPIVAVTSPELALIRFHGRRAETWEAHRHSGRREVPLSLQRVGAGGVGATRIREAAEEAREMHILMNNCYANYGSTVNADVGVPSPRRTPWLGRGPSRLPCSGQHGALCRSERSATRPSLGGRCRGSRRLGVVEPWRGSNMATTRLDVG
jgi:hypothetical protein